MQAGTFLARGDLKKPSGRLAYTIGDSVKPKAQENVTAEIRLGFLSLTVLDSLCGMVCALKRKTHASNCISNMKVISYRYFI